VPLLLVLVLLAVLGGVVVVAAGRGSVSLPDEQPDRSPRGRLAEGEFDRADVDGLRFSLAFRGYRMDEVDDVLDRLVRELADRDARIAELSERHDEA
jgi:DivIVA domain-containing protein